MADFDFECYEPRVEATFTGCLWRLAATTSTTTDLDT